MNTLRTLPRATRLAAAFLLVAAAGFVIQIISGIQVPAVPPGLVMMLVAAALVAFLPWRWIPLVGAGVGLFLLVGVIARSAVANLLDPTRPGVLIGAWIQFLAVFVVIVAGIIAVMQMTMAVKQSERKIIKSSDHHS